MSRFIKTTIVFFWIAVQSTLAAADPFCWFRSESPLDTAINGPVELGPEWKVYKLVKPFKVSPHVYEVGLLLKKSDFDFPELSNPNDDPSVFLNRWLPRSIATGQIYQFDVKLRNSALGWVNLTYTTSGTSVFESKTYTSVGFTIHPDNKQGFYPQDSVIEEVHIRANHKVSVEHIRWTASGYFKWPCRKWSEVPASEFITPER